MASTSSSTSSLAWDMGMWITARSPSPQMESRSPSPTLLATDGCREVDCCCEADGWHDTNDVWFVTDGWLIPDEMQSSQEEEKAVRDDGKESVSAVAVKRFTVAKHKKAVISPEENFQKCIKKIRNLIHNHETATVKAVDDCMSQFVSSIKSMGVLSLGDLYECLDTALLLTRPPFKTNDLAIQISTQFFWKIIDNSTKKLTWIRESYSSLRAALSQTEVQAKIERCYKTIMTSVSYTRHDKPDHLGCFIDLKRELEHSFYDSFRSTLAQDILHYINKFATQSKTSHQTLCGIIARFDELPKPSSTSSRS